MTTNQFEAWQRRLNGEAVEVHEDQPQPGFYAMKENGKRIPVAIWINASGDMVARDWDAMRDPVAIWTWCAKTPISRELAKEAIETGSWPDVPEQTPAEMGHNLPEDEFEALTMEAQDKIEQIEDWLSKHPEGATSALEADMARNMEAQAQALQKRSQDMHAVEKKPHLEAGRAVDEKYRSLRESLSSAKQRMKQAWGKFAIKEEVRRRAAETADTQARPVQVGGGVGKKAGLTTQWDYEIQDYRAAVQAVSEYPEVLDAVHKVIKRIVKAQKGQTDIAGVQAFETRVPR